MGVVRHDNDVRVHQRFSNLGLAVDHWIFRPLRNAFSVDVLHKKCSFCRNPGGGPPTHTKTAKMKQVFAIATTTKRYKTMSQKIAKAQVKYNNPEK